MGRLINMSGGPFLLSYIMSEQKTNRKNRKAQQQVLLPALPRNTVTAFPVAQAGVLPCH